MMIRKLACTLMLGVAAVAATNTRADVVAPGDDALAHESPIYLHGEENVGLVLEELPDNLFARGFDVLGYTGESPTLPYHYVPFSLHGYPGWDLPSYSWFKADGTAASVFAQYIPVSGPSSIYEPFNVSAVPEPSSAMLMLAGLAAAGAYLRNRRRSVPSN